MQRHGGYTWAMGAMALGLFLVGCGNQAVPQGNPSPGCRDVSDCAEGSVCTAGTCVVEAAVPTVEIGLTDPTTGTFTRLDNGAVLPLYTGEQWGHHVLMTVRAADLPTAAFFRVNLMVDERVTVMRTGEVIADLRSISEFLQHPDGLTEMINRVIFFDVPIGAVDGERVALDMTLTAVDDESVTADVHYEFVLEPAFGSVNPVER